MTGYSAIQRRSCGSGQWHRCGGVTIVCLLGMLSLCAGLLAAEAPPQPGNPVAQQAARVGIGQPCLNRVNNLSAYLIGEHRFDALNTFDPQQPAERLFSSAIGSSAPSGTQLAFMSIAPDEHCSASYEIVKVWQLPCSSAVQTFYPQYRPLPQSVSGALVFSADDDRQLFALGVSARSCVTIERAALFDRPPVWQEGGT